MDIYRWTRWYVELQYGIRSQSALCIGIYDATNTTAKRRKHLIDMLRNHGSYDVLFLESICDDPLIIDRNIRTNKVKQPLYQNMQPEEAVQVEIDVMVMVVVT